MTKPKHECKETPSWLTTMGDMSLLLLVFFVLLVSIMTQDRDKYHRLEEALRALSMVGKVEEERSANLEGDTAAQNFKAFSSQSAGETDRKRIEGTYRQTQTIRDGTSYTIAGEQHAFAPGRWELNDAQKRELVRIKRWMWGRRNLIEIRGHASAHVEDSVVVENGRARPFDPVRDAERKREADHSRLSFLRAEAAKKFFMEPHPELGDRMRFTPRQLRIRIESFSRNLRGNATEADRAVNRRIEVVATPEMLEE